MPPKGIDNRSVLVNRLNRSATLSLFKHTVVKVIRLVDQYKPNEHPKTSHTVEQSAKWI